MKKYISILGITVFFIGCATPNNTQQIDKKISTINIDKKLIKKYHITSDDLIKFEKYYIFTSPSPKGTEIIFLNKDYNIVKKISTPYFFDVKKMVIYKDKIYIAGINEKNNYPELLILNKDGKIISKSVIPKKYALIKDLYINNGNNYLLIDIFKNGKSYIQIYKNGKLIKQVELDKSTNGSFVFKIGNNLFVIGTIKNTTQDAFVANLSKGWIRYFDLGMDENIDSYKIRNNEILINLHSTDEMGADSYYEIILDIDGKIKENKCKMKFNPLPMRFRT